MNELQLNQKEMFSVVLIYLNNHASVWSVIPKIGSLKTEFESLLAVIEQKVVEQDQAKTYLGLKKKDLKRLIADKADIMNDQVEAFALIEDKPELALRMDQSKSDLIELKNEMFIDKVDEILVETEKYIKPLSSEYGVTVEQIKDLSIDLDNFKGLNGMPRKYQIDSIVATKDLVILFKECNDLLKNKLDKLMKIFKRRNASFYNGYLAARRIVNN
nr:hypothetical protein [uncultured Carboxylicivirga sp.]